MTSSTTSTPDIDMVLPRGVDSLISALAEIGRPLLVGGAVRDTLVAHAPTSKDIDVEVHGATTTAIVVHLAGKGFHVDEVGRSFGVVKVSGRGITSAVDVSVPRREITTGSGHRDFTVVEDPEMGIAEASARRDFTINAIMFDPVARKLIDPHGGIADLRSRRLRHVSGRFTEDPLRVLRGAQFAARFDLTADVDTVGVCRDLRSSAGDLSSERIADEWVKMFTRGVRPSLGLSFLREVGWDDIVQGLERSCRSPKVARGLDRVPGLPVDVRPAVAAAVMASALPAGTAGPLLAAITVGKDTEHLAADLDTVARTRALIGTAFDRKTTARRLARSGWTFRLQQMLAGVLDDVEGSDLTAAGIAEGLGDGPEADLLTGKDILTAVAGRKPGPWVGEILDLARESQFRGEFTDRGKALQWLKGHLQSSD